MIKKTAAALMACILTFLLVSCSELKEANPDTGGVNAVTESAEQNPDTGDTDTVAAAAVQSPAVSPIPAAAPQPTPSAAEVEAELEQAIRDSMLFDVAAMLPEGEDAGRLNINLFNYTESRWILDIRDDVNSAIIAGVAQAESSFPAGAEMVFDNQITSPSWQYLYMLAQLAAADAAQYEGCIKSSLSVEVGIESGNEKTSAEVRIEPVYYRDAIRSVIGEDKLAYLRAESAFDYMNTVFDEELAKKEYALPPEKGNLSQGITWPLQRYIRLRKTWYAKRDDGARKHTGTDIWAKSGTEIYSCTDGTVFFIGEWGGGGNSVIVEDDYGYLFYYHHMKSLPDFIKEGQRVKAGQHIGYVGNTGSSSRSHLHLTIVHPDGMLVDPYTYLKAAKP